MDFSLQRHFPDSDPTPLEWNALVAQGITHVPFLRWEYLRAWWETRGGGEWPAAELVLVTARERGQLIGIAPLFHAVGRDGIPALWLLGSIEISDYLDLIVSPERAAAFVPALLDHLASSPDVPSWQVLDWVNIPEDSPTLQALADAADVRDWSFSHNAVSHTPIIHLPGNFETYLASIDGKQRHEIRRKMRRAVVAGDVRWFIAEDPRTLDADIDSFLDLMAEDPQKAAFLNEPMRRQQRLACRAAFENGWLQLAFLEINGRRAAAYLNFDYLNRIWVYNSGFSREFNAFSPGWVLLGHLLQWANEHGRSAFDFLRGEEEYKYRFGALDGLVVRARISR